MYASLHCYKTSSIEKVTLRIKRSFLSCFCLLVLMMTAGALQQARANVGDRTRLGQAGEWKDTIGAVVSNNRLYTIEKSGALYVTDLSNGKWSQIGKAEFANTRFLFAVAPNLYTIETDGSLYRVSQVNGAWSRVGQAGEWRNTIAGTILNGRLYTVESNGILYETNPATGVWKQIGKPEFANTRHMLGADGSLYTIEDDGLYRVNPTNGSWGLVGKAEDWRGTRAVIAMTGRLYSINRGGGLYEGQLTSGAWVAVGKPVFGNTIHMFESGYKLYTIDADGSLYVVETPPLAG